jgi:acyl-CoA synthetase (AMP-forming)/AMP-acid ligase II
VHELEYVLNQAGIRTLVAAPSFKTSDYAAMIDEVRPNCPALRDVLLIGRAEWTSLVTSGRAADASVVPENQATLSADIMAGSPCPVEVMKQVIERMGMREVTICCGMTETSPVSTQTRADDSIDRRVSTGDLAVMDEEGYLNITGRIKDMVIRGGENVYPREIEEFLYTHPDILDAQVVGVPDERYGEELMAWVRLREGAEPLTAEALKAFCTGKLAHYKIPRYVHVVDEFPMTVTGKIRKVEMRQAAVELLGLQNVAATRHA